MEPASGNEPLKSSTSSDTQKMRAIVVKHKPELTKELEKAKQEGVWKNREAVKFVEWLIELGNLEEAKAKTNGRIPDPGGERSLHAKEKNADPPASTELLDLAEFIRYAVKCSREANTETEQLEIMVLSVSRTVHIDCHDEQSIGTKLEELQEQSEEIKFVNLEWSTKVCAFSPKRNQLTKSAIDKFFGRNEAVAELEKFLPLLPEKEEHTSEIMKPNTKYVVSDPVDPEKFFVNASSMQPDKKYAIVVAGESGSGKSVFAWEQSKKHWFLPLYLVLTEDELQCEPKPDLEGYAALNRLFGLAIEMAGDEDGARDRDRLFALKAKVNLARDYWSRKVLEQAIATVKERGNATFGNWLEGNWRYENRPEKVAIIVDEATDIDLVEGLVLMCRETMARYSKLAKKTVQLVLAGVGLDAIREKGRVGTNPAYSNLVVMKGPNVKAIEDAGKISDEVSRALKTGIFARVLKTNTRMFFRSVVPILQSPYHAEDAANLEPQTKKARLMERLTDIGSFRPLMDHGPRYYVNQNTVKMLSPKSRHSLLLQSFAYHLVESMEGLDRRGDIDPKLHEKLEEELKIVKDFEDYKNFLSDPANNIFAKGLASRRGTSEALKYLACFGLTCTLRATFGDEFEELTALHFMRYMEAQGYQPLRFTLKEAWPPKRSKGDMKSSIEALRTTLEKQHATEIRNLNNQWGDGLAKSGKWCLVFSQGTANAQGGDVLALLLDNDEKKAHVETIQCKHFKNKPGDTACREWWNSMGVELPTGGTPNLRPDDDSSAAYSFLGLESFRSLLDKWLNDNEIFTRDSSEHSISVKLGKRTLAMSFPTPSHFPIPDSDDCRVWFREMFEPTISVLRPKVAVEYNDTIKEQ